MSVPVPARTATAVLAATMALAFVACGDDKKAALTKEEWIERADTICADVQTEFTALGPAPVLEFTKLPDWASKGVALRTKQINNLRALEEPTEMKAGIDATLDKATALLDQARTSLDGATTATPALINSFRELQVKQEEVQKELAAHGPAQCAPQS